MFSPKRSYVYFSSETTWRVPLARDQNVFHFRNIQKTAPIHKYCTPTFKLCFWFSLIIFLFYVYLISLLTILAYKYTKKIHFRNCGTDFFKFSFSFDFSSTCKIVVINLLRQWSPNSVSIKHDYEGNGGSIEYLWWLYDI